MLHKTWKHIKENKATSFLNLCVFLVFITPYSYVYSHRTEDQQLHWIARFIIEYKDTIIVYLPVLIFTIGFQITQKTIWKKFFLVANLIMCCISFIVGFLSVITPIQDFLPGIGLYLTLTFFPLMIIVYKIEHKKLKNS